MSQNKNISRRGFLRTSATTAAASAAIPYIVSGMPAVAAEAKFAAPSDRLTIGLIGCGGQGTYDVAQAMPYGDLVAVCDVNRLQAANSRKRLAKYCNEKASQKVPGIRGGIAENAKFYEDYRAVLDRKDINTVIIGTPDHWHTKPAIEALLAGKDVYCEKPLTLTVDEGKQICKAVKKTGAVFQVGTQQRSTGPFAQAVAIVREGRIGDVKSIKVAIGGTPRGGPFEVAQVPEELNWDMWLGQAPKVDYLERRCLYEFRWWYEYSGGKMTDWGAHHVDIAHWALNASDTSPVSFDGTATHPVEMVNGHPSKDNFYNTAVDFTIKTKFANGVELTIVEKDPTFANGVMINGTKGRIFVNRGRLKGKAVEELKDNPLPEDALTRLYNGKEHGSHLRNFSECIKTRDLPISDVFSHHRAMTTCHLANISIRLGRKLNWDPKTEQIVNDSEANSWLKRTQREGFEIPTV